MMEAEDLYAARDRLSDLLERYKETGDPALMRELMDAMAELQSAFQSLMRRMAEMRKGLPEEFVNADAMKQAGMSDLAREMERLRQALNDGDMESASDMAGDFLSMMEEWLQALEDSADSMGKTLSREAMEKLSGVSDQLDDLIRRQQMVEDELRSIHDSAMDQAADLDKIQELKQKIKEDLARFGQEARQARSEFYRLRPNTMEGAPKPLSAQENRRRYNMALPMVSMPGEAGEVGRTMDDGNIEKALDKAESLQSGLESAIEGMDDFAGRHKAGPPRQRGKYEGHAGQAKEALESAVEGLRSLQEELSMSLSEDARNRLDELSKLQEQIRDDVHKTMDDYESVREEAPSLPGDVSEQLGQASQKMHDSSGEMMLGDPGRAMAPARDARGHLEQAAEALGEARNQMGQGMMGMGGMPRGSAKRQGQGGREGMRTDGEVEIPDEDQFKVSEEFRKEILKAMKEGAPETYKKLNKDYYERLVR